MHMVRHRAALSMDFVSASCRYVATLCRNSEDWGVAAGNCEKAADALGQNEGHIYGRLGLPTSIIHKVAQADNMTHLCLLFYLQQKLILPARQAAVPKVS